MDFDLIFISFCLSFPILILTQKLFLKYNFTDKVGFRSSHNSIATRSGGISVFITIFFLSVYFYLSGRTLFDYSFIIPLLLLVIVGIYDDIKDIDFKLKFIFQIIAAKIIIDNGLIIDNLHGVIGVYELNRVVAQVLTIFIIVAIINSINFIDGIDGLAKSIIIIFIVSFEVFTESQSPFFNLSLILIPSLIAVYFFNFRRENKIFLGDSGSLFLGGISSIYIIYILSSNYIIKPEFDLHKIVFVFSIFVYPIVDIIRVVILRISKGKSPFQPDKNHIHHILLKKFNNHFVTTLLISCFSIFVILFTQKIL